MPAIIDDIIVGPPIHEIIDNQPFERFNANSVAILWNNLINGATAAATGVDSGDPSFVLFPETYRRITAGSGEMVLTVTLPANINIDSIGVTCATNGGMTIATSDTTGGAFTTRYTQTGVDGAVMFLSPSLISVRRIRVTMAASTNVTIASVFAGVALRMERSIYVGHTPSKFARDTDYQTQISETGEWLGRSVIRRGKANEFSFNNITPDFMRSEVDPFILSAQTKPFFILWRPIEYAQEAMYAWVEEDIRPQNALANGLMSVQFSARGYGKR